MSPEELAEYERLYAQRRVSWDIMAARALRAEVRSASDAWTLAAATWEPHDWSLL